MTETLNLEGSEVSLQPCMKAYTFELTTSTHQGPQKRLQTVLCTSVYIGREILLKANQGSPVDSLRLHCVSEVVLQNNQTIVIDVQTVDIDPSGTCLSKDLTEDEPVVETSGTLKASDEQPTETGETK